VTKVLLSWSSGKDSAWTLHLLRQQPNIHVAALLTTFNSTDALSQIPVKRCQDRTRVASKILFVSEERSPDVAEEALNTGAGGYVVKSDANSELLPAVKSCSGQLRRRTLCLNRE
jgi:DNA-binding NarL/FixJ family response regulator